MQRLHRFISDNVVASFMQGSKDLGAYLGISLFSRIDRDGWNSGSHQSSLEFNRS